ncbi:MAG: multidrug DMT transporter permease [Ignavibacteriae bacterium HGW-Ignavibacteriae-2]|nr:MAG: multidrug DMT transporter permease [Ignavibacteriae bacterium HGW-Ignavibacteriae-2]
MMIEKNTKAYLAWAAVSLIWGTTYLAIKIGVNDLPPLLFAGLRWGIAGPVFIGILLINKQTLPQIKDYKHLAVIGILLLGITNALVVIAEIWLPSGLTALLLSTMPLFIVLIEFILSGAGFINIKIISGLFLCLLGVVIIFMDDLHALTEGENLSGILLLLLANISWAIGSHYSKRVKVNSHPLMAAAFQMTFAGILQIIAGVILGEVSKFSFTHDSLIAFLYLLIIASILGYGSYIYAISHLPVSFVTTYAYINPVIALMLGWFVLNEEINLIISMSAVIILLGVWLVRIGTINTYQK